MNKVRFYFAFFLFCLFTTTTIAQPYTSQKWNYKAYPELPFSLDEIELDITLGSEPPLLQGTATYHITSRRPNLTQIVFSTADLDIRQISWNETPADYRISTDSLIIELPDTLTEGNSTSFQIAWESSSPYGIYTDVYENMWTSLNPNMRSHWLPVPDHPEVESSVAASFTFPADKELVFPGSMTEEEVISTEERRVRWATAGSVSPSGISLVMGDMNQVSARAGVKEVSLWVPEDALMDEVRDGLLEIAVETIKDYEQKLEFEFPSENLQVVVLPDHHWEEVQAGEGIIYLYQNLGSLSTQLRRGIAAQWFGSYHRYLNPVEARYELLKSLVVGEDRLERLNEESGLESIKNWNRWVELSASNELDFERKVIAESLPELLSRFKGVTDWDFYADHWYDQVGSFWEYITPNIPEKEGETERVMSYHADYRYDEMENSLTLVFEARNNPAAILISAKATEFGFSDTTTHELSFTGAEDSVQIDISSDVEYVTLEITSEEQLQLQEQKPFMFLVRQLTNPEAEVQIQAAELLRNFTDNPDVQLAIQDVLRNEEEPEVRAALLETLSTLTEGASGTEETFLDGLNSDELSIRLSSLRSLANYPENDQVKNAVQNSLLRSEEDTVFHTALATYRQLAEIGEIRSIAERFSDNEQHQKAIQMLEVAVSQDTTRESLSLADRYALGNFPYEIRQLALELLKQHETNEDYWAQTLEMLLEDHDPRIRYQSLDAIRYLGPKDTVDLLSDRLNEEQDPRIREELRRLIDRNS